MSHNSPTDPQEQSQAEPEATPRGADDRRGSVAPHENPALSSPEVDQEAIDKGEETLERIKPY